MSIIGAEPAAVGGAETVGTVKRAIALAGVFIIVETVLVPKRFGSFFSMGLTWGTRGRRRSASCSALRCSPTWA